LSSSKKTQSLKINTENSNFYIRIFPFINAVADRILRFLNELQHEEKNLKKRKMARYTGPKTKISRIFGEPILGNGKWLGKNSNPPGMHGAQRKRKTLGEYATQLKEKQKAKYTYGLLEKQFRNTFTEAARRKGVTGENLIKLLEARLDNTIFRLGIAPSRPAARQLVSHKHVTVNDEVVNVPSFQLKPGDMISLKEKSAANTAVTSNIRGKNQKFSWLDWNEKEMKGTFIAYPERESVPENIKEQLIVELYSK
jgi:small subunit ribosomal protein S4